MAKRLIPNQPFTFPDTPPVIKSWRGYVNAFGRSIPKEKDIVALQKAWASDYAINKTEILKSLNEDFFAQINDEDWIMDINKNISNIEDNLNNLRDTHNIKTVLDLENNLNELILEWKQIHNRILSYNNTETVSAALTQLNNNIENLKFQLSNYSASESVLNITSYNMKGEEVSLLKQLQGISTALKGFELEAAATEYINKRFIESDGDEKEAIQTGGILYIGSSGKSISIKEDISLIDKCFYDKKVTLKNKEQITIRELLERLKKNETVVLTNQGYAEFQKWILNGISAKTTKSGNEIVFHSGLTVDWLKNNGSSNTPIYWRLYHYSQLSEQYKNFNIPKGHIYLLANYVMSTALNKIIGIKNNILLTRKGYEWTSDYISSMINDSNYIYISGISNLIKADKGSFGTRRVLGPNI